MMYGKVFFITLLAIPVLWCCSRSERVQDGGEIKVTSGDGVSVAISLYVPAHASRPPGLILVHRYGADRAVWGGFAQAARDAGMLVAAVDLRGHGGSRTRDGETIHYSRLTTEELLASLGDIDAAKRCLLDAGAHPENLAVAGEGLGANLALRYALQSPDIQAVVMVSPGLDYNGITTEEAIKQLKDCPALLAVCEGDAYGAMSASALKAAAPVFAELRSWPGAAHGTDLFAVHPESMQYILQWLNRILDKE